MGGMARCSPTALLVLALLGSAVAVPWDCPAPLTVLNYTDEGYANVNTGDTITIAQPYVMGIRCQWLVLTPPGTGLITALYTALGPDTNASIVLYDGDSETAPVLWRLYGRNYGEHMDIVTNSTTLVVFQADNITAPYYTTDNALSMAINFGPNVGRMYEPCQPYTEVFQDTLGVTYTGSEPIVSMGQWGPYGGNLTCVWNISTLPGKILRIYFYSASSIYYLFNKMAIQGGDAMMVYDGVDDSAPPISAMSGFQQTNPSDMILTSGNHAFIKWVSQPGSKPYTGQAVLNSWMIDPPVPCSGRVVYDVTQINQVQIPGAQIYSRYWSYAPGTYCEFEIVAPEGYYPTGFNWGVTPFPPTDVITFYDGNTTSAPVMFRGQKITNTNGAYLIGRGQSVLITFQAANNTVGGTGMLFQLRPVTSLPFESCNGTHRISDLSGTFTANVPPGQDPMFDYLRPYETCAYEIDLAEPTLRILLTLDNTIKLPPGATLTVYDTNLDNVTQTVATYTRDSVMPPTIYGSSYRMSVVYRTTEAVEGRFVGFSFSYSNFPYVILPGCDGTLALANAISDSQGQCYPFYSSNPLPYGSHCSFVFKASNTSNNFMHIAFYDFYFRPKIDILRVYDGNSTAAPLLAIFDGSHSHGKRGATWQENIQTSQPYGFVTVDISPQVTDWPETASGMNLRYDEYWMRMIECSGHAVINTTDTYWVVQGIGVPLNYWRLLHGQHCTWSYTYDVSQPGFGVIASLTYLDPGNFPGSGAMMSIYDGPDNRSPLVLRTPSTLGVVNSVALKSGSMFAEFQNSNQSEWWLGGLGIYMPASSSLMPAGSCLVPTSASGELYLSTDLNYRYGFNKSCTQRGQGSPGTVFTFAPSSNVRLDIGWGASLILYDGNTTSAPVLFNFTNIDGALPGTYATSGPAFLLVFTSPKAYGAPLGYGYRLAYSNVVKLKRCNGARFIGLTAGSSGSTANVEPPLLGVTSTYEPGTVCSWTLQSEPGSYIVADYLTNYLLPGDTLVGYDGDEATGAHLFEFGRGVDTFGAGLRTTGSTLTMVFHASSQPHLWRVNNGFSLDWFVVQPLQCMGNRTITAPHGTLHVDAQSSGQECWFNFEAPIGFAVSMRVDTTIMNTVDYAIVYEQGVAMAVYTGGPGVFGTTTSMCGGLSVQYITGSIKVPGSRHLGIRIIYDVIPVTYWSDSCRLRYGLVGGTVCPAFTVTDDNDISRYLGCNLTIGDLTMNAASSTPVDWPGLRAVAGGVTVSTNHRGQLRWPAVKGLDKLLLTSITMPTPILGGVTLIADRATFTDAFVGNIAWTSLRGAGRILITRGDSTSFIAPNLLGIGTLALTEVNGITTVDLPRLVSADIIKLDALAKLATFNVPALKQVATSLTMQSTSVRELQVSQLISVLLMDINSNGNLRTINASGLLWGTVNVQTNFFLTSIDVGRATGPSFTVRKSKLTSLNLKSATYASVVVGDNAFLTSISAPALLQAPILEVSRTSLVDVGMPRLTSAGRVSLSRNLDLERLELCALDATTLYALSISQNPLLSCHDLGVLFQPADNATITDCSSAKGMFGCAYNVTRRVPVETCGYTVACIQEQIDLSFSNQNASVFVPPGIYLNCTVPLNLRGKAIRVYGPDAVIDCESILQAMIFENGEGPDTVISGLAINHGTATTGGLVLINGASPTLINLSFRAGVAEDGGAMALINGAAPTVIGCFFGTHLARRGSALFISDSTVFMEDCTILGVGSVTYTTEGGAIWLHASAYLPPPHIRNVVFDLCGAARGGTIFTDTGLNLVNVTINRGHASQFGGGLAAIPSAATGTSFNLTGCTLTENSAPRGGALFGFSANFLITDTVLANNEAGVDGGGALSVTCNQNYRIFYSLVGPCVVEVVLDHVTLSNNTATGDGGALQATDVMVTITDSVFERNEGADGGAIYASVSSLDVRNTVFRSNAATTTGGAVFCEPYTGSCNLELSSFTNNHAGIAGGAAFLCAAACPNATLDADTDYGALALPSMALNSFDGNGVEARGYGPDTATDASRLAFSQPPASQVVSGNFINADNNLLIAVSDGFGQTVTASTAGVAAILSISLEVAAEDGSVLPSGAVVLGGPQTALAQRGVATFVGVTMTAANLTGLDTTYTFTCRLSAAVSRGAHVTLLPCPAGEGRASLESAVVCRTCGAGTMATGAPDYVCESCPAGSEAPNAGTTLCTPCAANTFAGEAGTPSCVTCPIGYSSAIGATACTQDAAPAAITSTGLTGTALTGTIAGVVAGLVCCAIIIVGLLYRAARRRTMQKYYLDNDATVRTGTMETPLQKDVKRIILASSTTRIGGGLYSNVYKAKYENKWIALKVIKGEMATNGTAQQEFRREALALSRLEDRHHPGVVKLQFFLSFNPMCIGVEFCNGGSLKAALANKSFPQVADRIRLAAEAASALSVVHACNTVHLDIKTDNMLLSAEGHLIVADFGIARVLGMGGAEIDLGGEYVGSSVDGSGSANSGRRENPWANAAARTRDSGIMPLQTSDAFEMAFTPQYVDPIRILFDKQNDEAYLKKADVFSFGIMMWAIFAQAEPYHGENPEMLVERLRANPSTRPAAIPGIPAFYESVMRACWSEVPALRPTFNEVFETLAANLLSLHGINLEDGYAHPQNVEAAPSPAPSRPVSMGPLNSTFAGLNTLGSVDFPTATSGLSTLQGGIGAAPGSRASQQLHLQTGGDFSTVSTQVSFTNLLAHPAPPPLSAPPPPVAPPPVAAPPPPTVFAAPPTHLPPPPAVTPTPASSVPLAPPTAGNARPEHVLRGPAGEL